MSEFVYVTYIRTTPQKLWQALTTPEFTRQFSFGMTQDSTWQPGAPWKMVFPDGRIADTGTVVEIEPERRYVLSWQNEFMPDMKAEGPTRMTCLLEPLDGSVKLTIIHEMEKDASKFIGAVSSGWPMILSGLKTWLETGEAMADPRAGNTSKAA